MKEDGVKSRRVRRRSLEGGGERIVPRFGVLSGTPSRRPDLSKIFTWEKYTGFPFVFVSLLVPTRQ